MILLTVIDQFFIRWSTMCFLKKIWLEVFDSADITVLPKPRIQLPCIVSKPLGMRQCDCIPMPFAAKLSNYC
jgi:hypothetical protein